MVAVVTVQVTMHIHGDDEEHGKDEERAARSVIMSGDENGDAKRCRELLCASSASGALEVDSPVSLTNLLCHCPPPVGSHRYVWSQRNVVGVLGIFPILIILNVPMHKVFQTLVQSNTRAVTQVSFRGTNIGMCKWYVARLRHRHVVALGRLAQRFFQRGNEIAHCHRIGVAEVVHAERRLGTVRLFTA